MNAVIQTRPAPVVGAGRSVVFRTRGHAHGPLNRVINASEAGQLKQSPSCFSISSIRKRRSADLKGAGIRIRVSPR